MLLIRRILTLATPLFLVLTYEALLRFPEHLFYLWGAVIVVIFLTLLWLSTKGLRRILYIFFITLAVLNTGVFFFIFFISGELARQIVIAGSLVLNGLYLTQIFYYNFRTEKYQVNALQNISSYLNLIAIFLMGSVGFSLILYLSWPAWAMTLAMFIISALLTFQAIWISKVSFGATALFALMSGLVCGEIFWALSFLPSAALVNAFILTVIYYTTINLGRYSLLGQLKASVVVRYLIISLSVLILTLITARWA
ncbi:MAG: hypothetical protein PHI73_02485 [Patescibacteria group bacterium]|nr:hypothetical protein [Patescibacteria group bacterium]